MKKVYKDIIILAHKFQKYAGIDAETLRNEIDQKIWSTLRNAASWNKDIMPFEKMTQQDGIVLSFDVTRDDSLMTKNITVSNLNIEPSAKNNLLYKYEALTQQVKDYLEKNWEVYPSKKNGEDIEYKDYTTHVSYPDYANSPIANK